MYLGGVYMSYAAIDVARYCIRYTNGNDGNISNLKLQKVLYFIQGFFFAIKGEECFEDEMEAWQFGPVVPSVYREFKFYGSNSIPSSEGCNHFFQRIGCIDGIEADDKELIDDILKLMSKYSASKLVDITHSQEPWKKAIKRKGDNTIYKEDISEFFIREYK